MELSQTYDEAGSNKGATTYDEKGGRYGRNAPKRKKMKKGH